MRIPCFHYHCDNALFYCSQTLQGHCSDCSLIFAIEFELPASTLVNSLTFKNFLTFGGVRRKTNGNATQQYKPESLHSTAIPQRNLISVVNGKPTVVCFIVNAFCLTTAVCLFRYLIWRRARARLLVPRTSRLVLRMVFTLLLISLWLHLYENVSMKKLAY